LIQLVRIAHADHLLDIVFICWGSGNWVLFWITDLEIRREGRPR
jgi:hypothetical protein